jgi:hypothetical protein
MKHQISSKLSSKIHSRYKKYCLFTIRSKLRKTPKFLAFFHIFNLLQVLTLIFRPEEELGLPWNYSSLSSFWIGLSIITRPDYLAIYFGYSYSWIIFSVIMWSYLVTKVMIFYRVRRKEFVANLPGDAFGSSWVRRYVVYIHKYTNSVLFYILPISILQSLMSISKSLEDNFDRITTQIVSSILLCIYLLIYLEDSLFLQKLSWVSYEKCEIVASAGYVVIYRCLILAVNISIFALSFSDNLLAYTIVMLSIGAYQSYLFAFKLPYGDINRNILTGFEGLLILWGGLVLFVTEMCRYTKQDSYFSILIYFIPIGFILYIYKEFISFRYNKLINISTFLNSTQVFHKLIKYSLEIKQSGSSINLKRSHNLIRTAILYEPNNPVYYLLQLSYITILNNNPLDTKVLLSQLAELTNPWLDVYIDQAREDHSISIQFIVPERKANEYILYTSYYHKLLKADKLSTTYLLKLYDIFLNSKQDSRILSRDMAYLHASILQTKQIYNDIISLFVKCPVVYEMYGSFLDVIENSSEADLELLKAYKYKQEIMRREETKETKIIYFDTENLVILFSAELETLGTIIDVKNSAGFGYKESELKGENLSIIFPPCIYSSYIADINRVYDIWNSDTRIQKFEESYILRNRCFLSPVMVWSNVVNLKNGELAIILAIKHHKDRQDIAILDDEGIHIICYVRVI